MKDLEKDKEQDEGRQRHRWLAERFRSIDRKLNHIIYRLTEEDPRSYRYRRRREGSGDDDPNHHEDNDLTDRSR